MRRPVVFASLALVALLAIQLLGLAPIAWSDEEQPSSVPGELIISFTPGIPEGELDAFYKEYGLIQEDDLGGADANEVVLASVPIDVSPEFIATLERDPRVEYAEPNYVVSINKTPDDPMFDKLWGLNNTGQTGGTDDADIDAVEAWEVNTGSDEIIVAVIDTGVDYTHEDLVANMWVNPAECPQGAGKCEADGEDDDDNGYVDDFHGVNVINGSGDPMDDFGHGTHVAGTIGAASNSVGVVGVNWKVRIVACKFLGASGGGSTADAIKCFNYLSDLKNKHDQNIVVTNSSWGGGGFSQALQDSMDGSDQPLHLCAAGNGNSSSLHYPAAYPLDNIISVAATDDNDLYANFSNYGDDWVDLAAPGDAILSSVPKGTCPLCDSSGYRSINGTSMATPHVAGAVALIKAEYAELTNDQIKQRILSGVDLLDDQTKTTLTNGRLNVLNTMEDDTTPPAAVSNLSTAGLLMTGVKLTWTATGDDGNDGVANGYDLRYSLSPISDANWNEATRASDLPAPQAAGAQEQYTLTGLDPTTTYYIALRVVDNVGNQSDISNVVIATTATGTVIFEDDMEDGEGDWTTKGTDDLWHQSEHRSNSPTTAWYYGQEDVWNYDTGGANSGMLISPPVELGDADDALLTFYEWIETESSSSFDRTRVQVSTDGSKWETIFESENTEDKWVKQSISLEAYVKMGSPIQFRFWFDTIDDKFNTFEGWYIDDVQVLVAKEEQLELQPLPNLVMQEANIGHNPASPIEGETVTINAVVLNNGSADAIDVLVQFVDVTDGVSSPVGPQQVLANIAVGNSAVAQASYDTDGKSGERKIQVIVDPHNFVAEINESDNQATKIIAVAAPPKANLVMDADNVGFDPPEPSEGDQVTINAIVLNDGAVDAVDVTVQFVDGTGSSSTPIGEPQVIDTVPAGGSGATQITYDTTGLSGNRTIQIVVNPNNTIPETDTSDNDAKKTLSMEPLPAPNLTIQSANIGFSPSEPTMGDPVTINATVLNDGAVDATEVLVQFVDATNSGSSPIGQQQVIELIPAGGSGAAQVVYETAGRIGDRKIEVIVDPYNFIPESKETDNEAKGTLSVAPPPLPNLVMLAGNIGFSPPSPTTGDLVTVSATILNDGSSEAAEVEVQFVDITSGESVPIGEKQILASVSAGGSAMAQIQYETGDEAGDRQIQVVVDPNNYVLEIDETDNSAKQKLTVGEVDLPNLVMLASNIEFQPPKPTTGDPVTINAVVLNDGAADAENVLVQFIDITSGEAVPIGKEQTLARIPAGASGSAQAVFDTTDQTKDRKIQVLVDSNNLIAESNDTDNEATKILSITPSPMPNLVVRADNIGFSPPKPQTGDAVTITAVVLNMGAATATEVVVQFVDVTGGSSIPIGEPQVVDSIRVGDSGSAMIVYDTADMTGDRKIQVVADPNNFIRESNETDNKGTETLIVYPPPAPNLTVQSSNIGFSPPSAREGEQVLVSVTILNGGTLDATDVLVQFVDVTDGGMAPIGEKQTIDVIAAGGDATTQVTYETTGKVGTRKIRVLVDPHTIIAESNESDNTATKNLSVTSSPAPNLTVQAENVGFDPANPVSGDSVKIQVTVLNNGNAPASDVTVQFVDVTGGTSTPIDSNQVIAEIPVGSSGTAQVNYETAGRSGDRKIQVTVDPNNLIPESNESDNVAKKTLEVTAQPAPNLVVKSSNIGFAPPKANPGDQVTINAIVLNDGTRDAAEVVVQFADVTGSGSAPIGQQQTIDAIPAGGSGSVQVTYDTAGMTGDRKIQVVVDPNNFIPESGESDNQAQKTLEMSAPPAPNLNIQNANVGFDPSAPTEGETVTINATVLNDGSADATDVMVQFLDATDDPAKPIGQLQVIDVVPVGGSGVAQVSYETTNKSGERKIEVVVDPNNFIQEAKETDNDAKTTLTVGPAEAANLVVLESNIGFNPPKPTEGDLTTISVVVLNNGALAATDVVVQFADVSGGSSTPIGAPQVIAAIPAGGSGSVQVTYDTSDKVGTRNIQVVADPNNFIVETDETDNKATRGLPVSAPPAPNLKVLPGNIKFEPPAPNEGDLVNIVVTVLNNGTADASDVVVQFVEMTASGPVPIGTEQIIDSIPLGESGSAQVSYDTTGKEGERTIQVTVDPNDTISESDEADNQASTALTVAPPPAPNLAVSEDDIKFEPASPSEGDQVTVQATVHNEGTAEANGVVVQFVEVSNGDSTQIGADQTIATLAIGGSATVQVTYDTTDKAGERNIQVTVDPSNSIDESDETDNQATKTLTVKSPSEEKPEGPNLTVTSSDINFDPATPDEGDPVVISATIHNKGTSSASSVEVVFAVVVDDEEEAIGETQTIATLAADASETVSVTFDTTGKAGEHKIQVTVDPENKVPESDETDNQADKTLTVASGSATTPNHVNLAVRDGDIGFDPLDADNTRVAVSVVVHNTGGRDVDGVGVQFISVEDASAGTLTEAEQVIASIPAGGTGVAEALFDTTEEADALTVQVLIDPGNSISESSELDNAASNVFDLAEAVKVDRPSPPVEPPSVAATN